MVHTFKSMRRCGRSGSRRQTPKNISPLWPDTSSDRLCVRNPLFVSNETSLPLHHYDLGTRHHSNNTPRKNTKMRYTIRVRNRDVNVSYSK